jgi:hypothetical protein
VVTWKCFTPDEPPFARIRSVDVKATGQNEQEHHYNRAHGHLRPPPASNSRSSARESRATCFALLPPCYAIGLCGKVRIGVGWLCQTEPHLPVSLLRQGRARHRLCGLRSCRSRGSRDALDPWRRPAYPRLRPPTRPGDARVKGHPIFDGEPCPCRILAFLEVGPADRRRSPRDDQAKVRLTTADRVRPQRRNALITARAPSTPARGAHRRRDGRTVRARPRREPCAGQQGPRYRHGRRAERAPPLRHRGAELKGEARRLTRRRRNGARRCWRSRCRPGCCRWRHP